MKTTVTLSPFHVQGVISNNIVYNVSAVGVGVTADK